MSQWQRIQRLELELAEALGTINRLTVQRDQARDIACRLEQELAEAAS